MDLATLDISSMKKKIIEAEGTHYPSKTYAEYANKPNYDTSKKEFPILVSIQKAHFFMLVKQNLLNKDDTEAIKKALSSIPYEEFYSSEYDRKNEDMYYTMESWMMKKFGDGTGNLHLGRSRNDIGNTTMRIRLRNSLLEIMDSLQELHTAFIALAKEYRDLIMVAHTHSQQAQIGTFGHILIGFAKVLERRMEDCKHAYATVNQSPMGAAAIETSGFNMDRDIVSELLGFDSLIENSYDAIACSDHISQAACAVKITAIEIGRITTSLLWWNTQEFDLIRCAPCFVGTSSIMPQKRNPGPLEYIRKKNARIIGECDAVLLEADNVPYEEYLNLGEATEGALSAMSGLKKVIHLLSLVMSTMGVEEKSFERWARQTFAGITEFSDMLVREEGINYRLAHHVAHEISGYCVDNSITLDKMQFDIIEKSFEKVVGRKLSASHDTVMKSLDSTNFVKVRTVKGGPAPEPMQVMLENCAKIHNQNDQWIAGTKSRLEESAQKLEKAFNSIN
ncbi:argininosuccinate lyase [Breznakiella homolactica]|uniref:Argininosuccinate lyase n=1 Tax=Breznakiella homolactica TaxID=2798577 RepID=A0A7T7XM24_9SPIR|nr:argininosuccinate lyase [Breznakiella homolactica]QQO08830.1 argininosuccinate lyase [Breznakiella homolactica]